MDIPILKLIAGKKLDSAGLFHNIQIIIIQMRQKISQRQTVTVKTPCSREPSSLWEILLGWDGSSWDSSLSMNIHVPSDRNLSTTASLAFGVGWIPTGLFLGTESPHRRSRIIGHLVDDEEDLPLVFDHNGIPLAW